MAFGSVSLLFIVNYHRRMFHGEIYSTQQSSSSFLSIELPSSVQKQLTSKAWVTSLHRPQGLDFSAMSRPGRPTAAHVPAPPLAAAAAALWHVQLQIGTGTAAAALTAIQDPPNCNFLK